jgi:ectoine hydroxylase-related dioxygenase (phytanoyl-CoA dioxygenase family)
MKLSLVAALAADEPLVSIARSALGNGAFAFRATLFDKSPDANWLVAWHQDTALPLREKREQAGWGPWSVKDGVIYAHSPATALSQVVALRVHLDDSTAENGPLRVLPGTHTIGILSDEELREVSGRTAGVNCTVSRGGVVAMRPLLVHASSKSQSEKPRRVLHIEYSAVTGFGDGLELAIA